MELFLILLRGNGNLFPTSMERRYHNRMSMFTKPLMVVISINKFQGSNKPSPNYIKYIKCGSVSNSVIANSRAIQFSSTYCTHSAIRLFIYTKYVVKSWGINASCSFTEMLLLQIPLSTIPAFNTDFNLIMVSCSHNFYGTKGGGIYYVMFFQPDEYWK